MLDVVLAPDFEKSQRIYFTFSEPRGVVNGTAVALGAGFIALQSEGHPIDFRRVELLDLEGCTDPRASNYKRYYVAPDSAACTYPE